MYLVYCLSLSVYWGTVVFGLQLILLPMIQWQAYTFGSLFISDVATSSQKDLKLFSATYILCSKKLAIKR